MTEHHKIIQAAVLSITNKYSNKTKIAVANAKIKLIKVDSSLSKGNEIVFRRIFIREDDSGSLSTVGWTLPSDILNCMICNSQFGYSSSKSNCTACGNVICSNCSSHTVKVSDVTFPKPVVVCCQCCWGQEIVDIAPNIELGLPLFIRDLTLEYGSCVVHPITPIRVLKSRKAIGNCHVYVNVCTSPFVPLTRTHCSDNTVSRNSFDRYITHVEPFAMVCGPETLGVGGVYVYDVIVHPQVIQPMGNYENEDPQQSHAEVSEFYEQVLKFIERICGEPIADSYVTQSQCTYYRHQLSQLDNQRLANALDPALGQLTMPIPSIEAFNDLHQIQVKIDDIKAARPASNEIPPSTSRNNANNSKAGGNAFQFPPRPKKSNGVDVTNVVPILMGNRIRSPSITSISSIPVTPFDPKAIITSSGGNSPKGSEESDGSSSDGEASVVPSVRTPNGPEIVGSVTTPSLIRNSITKDKKSSPSSVNGDKVDVNEGRKLLTVDMLVHYKDKDIDGKSVNILKGTSVRIPKTLVGWQIALLSSDMKSMGIFVVTGIRKTKLFKSEYRLSSIAQDDQWLLLKRSPTKKGTNFQPLRKVFTPPK